MVRSPVILRFLENLKDVVRLLEFHVQFAGASVGYKHNVGVLNKSAIVLLVACWEAYVEDLASIAFDVLLADAPTPSVFPRKVLVRASKCLRDSADETEVWKLAGDAWRQVLSSHRQSVLERIIGKLNTPKPAQVNDLFESLLGITSIADCWHWKGMSTQRAEEKLLALVQLRGEIAHRVSASRPVHKADVMDYVPFVQYLAALSHNTVRAHVMKQTRKPVIKIDNQTWGAVSFRKVG